MSDQTPSNPSEQAPARISAAAPVPEETQERLVSVDISQEMRSDYIDYAMSVIAARALPDVRDGLKPVQRRILFGMRSMLHDKPYRKSARIVGDVLGKYHPHGDHSIYDAMVRMAQPFSMRLPLVDGQGNFGSVDGDAPAAIRYTEARLSRAAEEMLADIQKETVRMQANFDDSLEEPSVLPAKLPNLLVNGASGIAVGMATNLAPHNLREVLNAVVAYIDNSDITTEALMQHLPAPDFPTGGIIYGCQGVKQAYEKGRGKVVVRAKLEVEVLASGRERIVVTEIPYMVNKAAMIEKTAQLISDKRLEGISDIRDESDKDGLRVVYELKKDAVSGVVVNNLYKHTALQTSFSINQVALVDGKPQTLSLKDLLSCFVAHRHEVLVRKTEYEHAQVEKKIHLLEGYLKALEQLDRVVSLVRGAQDTQTAREALQQACQLSHIQSAAVLELRLQRLTSLEREKIVKEHAEALQFKAKLEAILSSQSKRMGLIREEMIALQSYSTPRRTTIERTTSELSVEDMIADEEMVLTFSNQGYIKRTPLTAYRTQARGGVGARGAVAHSNDFTTHLFVASMHSYLLVFTKNGKVYWRRVYDIPEGSRTSRGRAIQNLIPIDAFDQVRSVIKVKNLSEATYLESHYVVMCTASGMIKKTLLSAYAHPRAKGIVAMRVGTEDELLEVRLTQGESHLVMALRSGRAIRFHERDVRPMGRVSAGVRGITLADQDDRVIGMVSTYKKRPGLLVVSERGYGKRSAISSYRITKRGGKGIKTLQITPKTGMLVAVKSVADTDELMIINRAGIAIRIAVGNLRVAGRDTQGVRLIRLDKTDAISSVARIKTEPV